MEKNNGGSAFPTSNYQKIVPISTGYSEGMTLRDYFAAKAMQALISDPFYQDQGQYKGWGEIGPKLADDAYDVADAMLTERANEPRP